MFDRDSKAGRGWEKLAVEKGQLRYALRDCGSGVVGWLTRSGMSFVTA